MSSWRANVQIDNLPCLVTVTLEQHAGNGMNDDKALQLSAGPSICPTPPPAALSPSLPPSLALGLLSVSQPVLSSVQVSAFVIVPCPCLYARLCASVTQSV